MARISRYSNAAVSRVRHSLHQRINASTQQIRGCAVGAVKTTNQSPNARPCHLSAAANIKVGVCTWKNSSTNTRVVLKYSVHCCVHRAHSPLTRYSLPPATFPSSLLPPPMHHTSLPVPRPSSRARSFACVRHGSISCACPPTPPARDT